MPYLRVGERAIFFAPSDVQRHADRLADPGIRVAVDSAEARP